MVNCPSFIRSTFNQMVDGDDVQVPANTSDTPKLTIDQQEILLNSDELRARNREQLIEKLERVIQEKNASISKLEGREHYLEDVLKKRNIEFEILEEKLRQFEEKTRTFEELHQLQVQTFEKTIRDCQIENERLCDHINDLTRALSEKTSFDAINTEKILTFDRITADIQLWRDKLDSYRATIEQREDTIANLKKEINDLHRKKQTNEDWEDNSFRTQIFTLQNTLRDRENEIENLKQTLRRVRDTLQPDHLSPSHRWKSCNEDIGRTRSSSQKKRSISPSVPVHSSSLDLEHLQKKFQSLTDRFTHVQQLLIQRDEQIQTLKKVHDKRWLRLKYLQKQYHSLKDELQSYTDEDILQKNSRNEFFYRKAIRKTRNGCSVCNDYRWRKANGINRRVLKHEDDDQVWNEVTKLRRENAKLTNENLSLHEKTDLQEVEINEQTIVLDELRHEIRRLNEIQTEPFQSSSLIQTFNDQEKHLIEELEKRLYELETERTNLIFEQERLKTNYDLCLDEKQHLIEQKTQIHQEFKQSKLRILALQDQLHKFKRNNQTNNHHQKEFNPNLTFKRRISKKKTKKPTITKSCLEMLLDQNATLIDDLHNESLVSNRQQHSWSIYDNALTKRKRQPSISSTISKSRYGPFKRSSVAKSRLTIPVSYSNFSRKPSIPSSIPKIPPIRIATWQKRIEQLEIDLTKSREENEHLTHRLTTTLSRINILKSTNQKLITEHEQFKVNHQAQSTYLNHDATNLDQNINMDSLHERLKNASIDAAQQRKLNKTLQVNHEILNQNLQSLTEKLTHTERDVASKRLLIESYKTRLHEMEINVHSSNEKNTNNQNNDERIKVLTETMEKLRISIESYKNRLQAITREKHDLDLRYTQLTDEHQKLKLRFEDIQSKFRLTDQQLRDLRFNHEQLNEEFLTSRRLSEQQLFVLNSKTQDSLKKITLELDRTLQRLNDYEKFINTLLHEIIGRSIQINEHVKRAREHQKQRESLSTTLPGYDTAMTTASRILNLTQDDLDDIMSVTDESFQINTKDESVDKNEKIRQKVSKLLLSHEECSSKLLKIFIKKLDEIQATDRELAITRHT